MYLSITTKNAASMFQSTTKNAVADMFHSITMKPAAKKFHSITTPANVTIVQNILQSATAHMNLVTITNVVAVNNHAAHNHVLNHANKHAVHNHVLSHVHNLVLNHVSQIHMVKVMGTELLDIDINRC